MTTSAPIFQLSRLRTKLLAEAKRQTERSLLTADSQKLETAISEALFHEKGRLRRSHATFFTRSREGSDRQLWSQVQRRMAQSALESPRREILDLILRHYGEEISSSFSPAVYRMATQLVPFGFDWLLNAASLKRFVPWKMKEQLSSRIAITGQVEQLKRLAQNGTVLLVPTHQSNLDSLLIGYVIYLLGLPPFAYGAGLNLFSNPVLSFFMSNLGAYTVDRKKSDPLYKAMLKNYSSTLLQEGVHSIFFPGGGRSRSGALEKNVKLGLLGTAVQAQAEILKHSDRRVYVVPMVVSYHSVLEASSLIEEYLSEVGKHRYLPSDDEGFNPFAAFRFFWGFFSSQSNVTLRLGRALDVFGNLVDDSGRGLGPNGTEIQTRRWLTTHGVLGANAARDAEYTRELGRAITHRFARENTVLSSHLVAFSFFEQLRARYPELPLFQFLKLGVDQRVLTRRDFLTGLKLHWERVQELADHGQLHLSQDLLTFKMEDWAEQGTQQLSYLQGTAPLEFRGDEIATQDLERLFYYRNRLTGYGMETVPGEVP